MELGSGPGKPSLVEMVGPGAAAVSLEGVWLLTVGTVLAGALLGTMLEDILGSAARPAGTLGAAAPARAELMGSLDGGRLVSTLVATAPEGFELAGNLEGTVLSNVEPTGTLEDVVLVVSKPVDTLAPAEQTLASPWSPAPPAQAEPVDEKEVPADGADEDGAGKRLARGMERVRGWKDTVGDTGPRGEGRLEAMPAAWAPPSSGSCS